MKKGVSAASYFICYCLSPFLNPCFKKTDREEEPSIPVLVVLNRSLRFLPKFEEREVQLVLDFYQDLMIDGLLLLEEIQREDEDLDDEGRLRKRNRVDLLARFGLPLEGLAAKEKETEEPDESERMQMTDARCTRCSEKKVGLTDIIHAGARGDRYQLECIACGNTWYAFRDELSTLTIEGPSVGGNVGTAPWATAKFEDVEKKLLSPREAEEKLDAVELFIRTSEPRVLESHKSFNKSRAEDANTVNNTE